MLISDTLRAISLYPINPLTVQNIMSECDLLDEDINNNIRKSSGYRRAVAKVYQYLADAPNVSEAGANYSFSQSERDNMRRKADEILAEIGDKKGDYGYIGEDFFEQ